MNRRITYLALAAAATVAVIILGLSVFATGDERDEASLATGRLAQGTVVVNFDGAPAPRPRISRPFSLPSGNTGWEAVKQALGEDNVTYEDYGGDLGILITGFEGVTLSGNRFWELLINGEPAQVGVSSYKVKDGDVLEFRVTDS